MFQGRVRISTGGKLREPNGWSSEILEATVKSGWKKQNLLEKCLEREAFFNGKRKKKNI